MSDINDLLTEIRDYASRVGLQPSTVARRAVGDGKFVARLEAGGQCLPSTMAKVRRYMAEHPPEAKGGAEPPAEQPAKVA